MSIQNVNTLCFLVYGLYIYFNRQHFLNNSAAIVYTYPVSLQKQYDERNIFFFDISSVLSILHFCCSDLRGCQSPEVHVRVFVMDATGDGVE